VQEPHLPAPGPVCVKHECIMVKTEGSKKMKIRPKQRKFNRNKVKFINFAEIGGEYFKFYGNRGKYTICIIGLGGMNAPAPRPPAAHPVFADHGILLMICSILRRIYKNVTHKLLSRDHTSTDVYHLRIQRQNKPTPHAQTLLISPNCMC